MSLQSDSSVDPQVSALNETIKNAAGWKSCWVLRVSLNVKIEACWDRGLKGWLSLFASCHKKKGSVPACGAGIDVCRTVNFHCVWDLPKRWSYLSKIWLFPLITSSCWLFYLLLLWECFGFLLCVFFSVSEKVLSLDNFFLFYLLLLWDIFVLFDCFICCFCETFLCCFICCFCETFLCCFIVLFVPSVRRFCVVWVFYLLLLWEVVCVVVF